MSDMFEPDLRRRLSSAPLPPAPPELHAFVAGLAERPASRRSIFRARRVLVTVPVVVLIGLLVGVSMIGTGPHPTSSAPVSMLPPTASFADELARFTAPGIAFDYPATWIDHSAAIRADDSWAYRSLAYLVDGAAPCSLYAAPNPIRTLAPSETCEADPEIPETLALIVGEYLRPVPGDLPYRQGITFDPTVPWDAGGVRWYVIGPDGGLYSLYFSVSPGELAAYQAEIDIVIASLELSAWTPTPEPVVDGWIRLRMGTGSVAFRQSWHVYGFTAGHVAMAGAGQPVALVSSSPLTFCEPVEDCHLFRAPPGTVVVRFWESQSAFAIPDWSVATMTVGGQPAFYSVDPALHGVVLRTWDIRRPGEQDNAVFTIDAAVSGDVAPELLSDLDVIVDGIEFNP